MVTPSPADSKEFSLEKRIFRFLESRVGAECIDKLQLTPAQRASGKADYFLLGRAVICEVKAFETDTKTKIDALLKPLMASEQAPLFYGEWRLENVLKHFPNGAEIKREVFDAATSAVENLYRKANRQIRETKREFGLPDASGALVMANDLVDVLSPEVISYRIRELFWKRAPNGQLRYPEIDAIWVLSETHFIEIGAGRRALPALLLTRDQVCVAGKVLVTLQPEWAAANGVPFLQMNPDVAPTVKFKKVGEPDSPNGPPTQQAVWIQNYRQSPYLRRHTLDEFRQYFHRATAGFASTISKDASPAAQGLRKLLLERATHVLEEIKVRGIDMKALSPGADAERFLAEAKNDPIGNFRVVEALGHKEAIFEIGRFYTDMHGKFYRCFQVATAAAGLILLDTLMGQGFELVIEADKKDWRHFWPILDEPLLVALERRFQKIVVKNPGLFK